MTVIVLHWTPGHPVVQHIDASILRRRTRRVPPDAMQALAQSGERWFR